MIEPTKAQARILRTLRENPNDLYINHDQYGTHNQYSFYGHYKHKKKIRGKTAEILIREGWIKEWEGENVWNKGFKISKAGLKAILTWRDQDFEGLSGESAEMSAAEVLGALKLFYTHMDFQQLDRYIKVPELARENQDRRVDLFVLDCWKGLSKFVFEIKVTRSDFINEMKKPEKREFGLSISNYFYFATPEGLINGDEIPIEAGLIEISDDGEVQIVIEAPPRETLSPSWALVKQIARKERLDHGQQIKLLDRGE